MDLSFLDGLDPKEVQDMVNAAAMSGMIDFGPFYEKLREALEFCPSGFLVRGEGDAIEMHNAENPDIFDGETFVKACAEGALSLAPAAARAQMAAELNPAHILQAFRDAIRNAIPIGGAVGFFWDGGEYAFYQYTSRDAEPLPLHVMELINIAALLK